MGNGGGIVCVTPPDENHFHGNAMFLAPTIYAQVAVYQVDEAYRALTVCLGEDVV